MHIECIITAIVHFNNPPSSFQHPSPRPPPPRLITCSSKAFHSIATTYKIVSFHSRRRNPIPAISIHRLFVYNIISICRWRFAEPLSCLPAPSTFHAPHKPSSLGWLYSPSPLYTHHMYSTRFMYDKFYPIRFDRIVLAHAFPAPFRLPIHIHTTNSQHSSTF